MTLDNTTQSQTSQAAQPETALTIVDSTAQPIAHVAPGDPRQLLMPQCAKDVFMLAKVFADAGMYADEGKPLTPAQCAIVIMTGIDLGMTPSQAMRAISVVKGKPCPSADSLIACVRRRKDVCDYITVLESSPVAIKIAGKRVDDTNPTIVTFTIEDAKTANLVRDNRDGSPGMYKKFPEQMLYARCAVKLVRRLWPDVALGLYTPDEIKDGRVNEDEIGVSTPAPAAATRQIALQEPAQAAIVAEHTDSESDPFANPGKTVVSSVDGSDANKAKFAARNALNARVKALESDVKEAFKTYARAAFNEWLPARMSVEQIQQSNEALDAIEADPFLDLLSLLPQAQDAKGHGD